MGETRKYLSIISRDLSQKVALADILFLRQEMRNVIFATTKGQVATRGKLNEYQEQLSKPFVKAHSYLIVNLARVEKMADEIICFDNGSNLKIGYANYVGIRKVFNKYLEELE